MRKRHNKISGQFSARLVEMLESPAWRVLSLSARRLLDRIEIELAHHGGNDNGKLPVTFDHFVEYGMHRHAVAPAMREAIALGFLVVTEAGRAGNAEYRSANKFRLTYRDAHGIPGDGSHEWRLITSLAEAEATAKIARKAKPPKKTKNQCRKAPAFSDQNRHRNLVTPVTITGTKRVAENITTSISRDILSVPRVHQVLPSGSAAGTGQAEIDTKLPACLPPSSTVSADASDIARVDLLHARIASKLGEMGWEILQTITCDELNRLMTLECSGQLEGEILELVRHQHGRRSA